MGRQGKNRIQKIKVIGNKEPLDIQGVSYHVARSGRFSNLFMADLARVAELSA